MTAVVVQDAIEGLEETPAPRCRTHIALKTKRHLPATSPLFVPLHNGPKASVVVILWSLHALFGPVTSLREVRAPAGVPYHSEYLAVAVDKLNEENLAGKELWILSDLRIPVYETKHRSKLYIFDDFCTLLTVCSSLHQPLRL
jgi:fatty acid synthase subunit alpha